MLTLIDTHTHLYLPDFDADRPSLVAAAQQVGVERFYLPNINSQSIEAMLQLENEWPGCCYAMMGLHPCDVGENYRQELSLVRQWLEKRRFAAVGEIGLDYYWDKTYVAQQEEAFSLQISWALEFGLPIIIHSRDAMDACIRIVAQHQKGQLRGIFHCFGGTLAQAQAIIDLGFLLGIGGVVTYKRSGLGEVVQQIPLEHIVLETDAPYLAPVPHRGKRNEPAYLRIVAETIAHLKEVQLEEVAQITTHNAIKLFGS